MKNGILLLLALLLSSLAHAYMDAIVGADSRKQITTLAADPFFKSIGFIYDADKNSYCTGTLITPKHVITSGHCVLALRTFPSPLARASALTFTPGKLNSRSAPYGIFNVVRIKTFAIWAKTGHGEHDVAVIELDRAAPLPVARLVSYKDARYLEGKPISVTGYSSQKERGTLWNGDGKIIDVFSGEQSFSHTADTMPGTSGSLVRMKVNDQWSCVGVHRGEYIAGQEPINKGVLFNQVVIKAIKRWVTN